MKHIKNVSKLAVKRAFVIADLCKPALGGSVENTPAFRRTLRSVQKRVIAMSEEKLDAIIEVWQTRLDAYNSMQWSIAEVGLDELGVWNRAGELPTAWTNCSLSKTAWLVARALRGGSKSAVFPTAPAAQIIPEILRVSVDQIRRCQYLYPIAFVGNTGTQGRLGLAYKTNLDLDDGCMRAIALAIHGRTKIRVYCGQPA